MDAWKLAEQYRVELENAKAEIARIRDVVQVWTETPEQLRDLVLTLDARELAKMHDAEIRSAALEDAAELAEEFERSIYPTDPYGPHVSACYLELPRRIRALKTR